MKVDSNTAAVVTGGASGLGAATARALAAKGAKVAIFDLQAEKGEEVAREIGGVFCEVNVTSDESVDAGFAKAREAIGQERILVNCAGTGNAIKTVKRDRETGEISHFPMEAFNFIIQINLVGTFRCIAKSAALPSRLGNGTEAASASFTCCGAAFISGVLKMPGRIVFTRMPSLIRSRAMGSVMPTTPPFDAE